MSANQLRPTLIQTAFVGPILTEGGNNIEWPEAPKHVEKPVFWVDQIQNDEQQPGAVSSFTRKDLILETANLLSAKTTGWPEAPRATPNRKFWNEKPRRVLQELHINRVPVPKKRLSCRNAGI